MKRVLLVLLVLVLLVGCIENRLNLGEEGLRTPTETADPEITMAPDVRAPSP